MMFPDLRNMEEITCPDCGHPLIVVPVEDVPGRHLFEGCRCGREHFVIPDCIVAGFEGAPKFLYKPLAGTPEDSWLHP